MPPLRRAAGVLLAIALLALSSLQSVRADAAPALDLRSLTGGASLRAFTYVLEDAGGMMTLAEARRADERGGFRRAPTDASFGITSSALWVRFDVVNRGASVRPWLLEIDYPHLDRIDLYALEPDGHTEHYQVGDQLAFPMRPVKHADFAFERASQPGARTRFYVRVRSEGSLRVPLIAWEARDFYTQDDATSMLLALFYGAMLVMAWYNLCVAALLRNLEYVYLAGLLLTIGVGIATLSGHLFQYVLPNQPVIINRSLLFSISLGTLLAHLYWRHVMIKFAPPSRVLRLVNYSVALVALLVLVAVLAPRGLAQRAVLVGLGLQVPLSVLAVVGTYKMGGPQMRFTSISFVVLGLGIAIALLAHANVLPPHPLALWAGHVAGVAYCVLASLALPARLNVMTERTATLNAQLSSNVSDLKGALAKAEQASEDARRATRVKDEFMATMSHELRTPLNAIINVPQGLLDDFATVRSASCSACHATFVLDPADTIDAQATCPECGRGSTMEEGMITQYTGNASHTARFLRKIERSGRYLLNLINGVLDFSKMEAGHLDLVRAPVDLAELLREVSDELIELARENGLDIALRLDDDPSPGIGDPMRLRQVLLNLLSNAIKFSEPGGVIEVTWKRDPDYDTVSVRDQGIGIARADHERVFESFEQVHKGDTRKYGGTGLGLSISRSLIRMHGGELWVESTLGVGSTFTFRIPRKNARAA